jgi:hypothetical protein
VQDGEPVAESVVGYWLPQVSSKTVGTTSASGVTYGHREILQDFRSWQQVYPDAILVLSTNFSSFRYDGYWVTVVPRPFTDAASVHRWCEAQQLSRDDCLGKRLSHDSGPEGNTAPR